MQVKYLKSLATQVGK